MTETVKHSPGPWLIAGRSAGSHIHADKGEVAWLRSYMGITDEEIEANSHLIAAAPDLLSALKAVYADHTYETPSGDINCRFCDCNTDHDGTFRDVHDEDCLIRTVRAAFAKAEQR